jgi:polyisoprenoid-binding protein YceI
MEERIKWELDPAHTLIEFKVRHLMITNVKGRFRKYELDATTLGNDFTTAQVELRIDPNSIDTNNDDRDKHMRSADFFDIENHGEITFRSTSVERETGDVYKLKGDLTIRGISKPIELEVEYGGSMTDPWGVYKVGFNIEGTVNRKDWGLNWNAALETGGWLVGDDVKINCDVQLLRVKERSDPN